MYMVVVVTLAAPVAPVVVDCVFVCEYFFQRATISVRLPSTSRSNFQDVLVMIVHPFHLDH